MKNNTAIFLSGILGKAGQLEVFIGFAPAGLLSKISFPDVLNEDTGDGYQRPYNKAHSADFRNYILRPGSSTPPLTFNLRKEYSDNWEIQKGANNAANLVLRTDKKCMTQVDCQHRLGELSESNISMAFMAYIGLDLRQEMAIFNVINSKAKGLSSSLTDYHESKLLNDLAAEAPHLFISRRLNEDPTSPWHRLVRYGGETTSGLKRRTSFRMMQKTVQAFLSQTKSIFQASLENKYAVVLNFWKAVRSIFDKEWDDHRSHLITKGIGLYGLMKLLGDIVKKHPEGDFTVEYFMQILSPLKAEFDWSSHGRFAFVGGKKGVQDVYQALKKGINI